MDVPPRVRASFDEPAVGARVEGEQMRVRGWVFDELGPLDRVLVVVGSLPPVSPSLGVWRDDVAAAFAQIDGAGSSGFQCDVDLRGAPIGKLPISLLARTADGEWHQPAAGEIEVVGPRTGPGKRPAAAFTIVQNEAVMLPLWLKHYGRHFAAEDLYVLNHNSTDGSIEAAAGQCQVIPIHRRDSFDHRWLRGTVEAFQKFLLQSYGTVLFSEADELVVADPRHYSGLAEYIARLAAPAARCVGFNVVHQPDEQPLDFDQPVLAQRAYWRASLGSSKRLLSRIPLSWSEGFHDEYNAPDDPPDPALILVHLHRVDYERCLAHHRAVSDRSWSPDDITRGDGGHNRIVAEEEFKQWFYDGTDLDGPRELIPEHLRALL